MKDQNYIQTLGYYEWFVVFDNNDIISQITEDEDGNRKEVSIDTVKEEYGTYNIASVILVPKDTHTHKGLMMKVNPDIKWGKKWIRTFTVELDEFGSDKTPKEGDVIECLSITPKDSQIPVYLYIYKDGSMKLTTDPEP